MKKIPTGMPGLDHITAGGLPAGRTTLVSGTAGSAKTILAVQFLIEGIKRGEPGVFVTFEETPEDIRKNMLGFGWDIVAMEREKMWSFVDGSPEPLPHGAEAGNYDLSALVIRVKHAIQKVKATRVSMDSLGSVFSQFSNSHTVRRELHQTAITLKELGVTALLTAERREEYGELARYGVEEFVTDNVIILRNVLEQEKRRRTIEILKFRGTTHKKGEYPFTILPGQGVVVIPLSELQLEQNSSNVRVTSGDKQLDIMCGGGFFQDSIILVSGATGCGKTLLVTEFVNADDGIGVQSNNEKSLLFAFEESREQLTRNAIGWGMDFEKLEQHGQLRIVCTYPEIMGLEDHLIWMKKEIDEFKPTRVAVDSLSALERASTEKGFREFVLGLTSFIKNKEIVGLFSSTTPTLLGGTSITEAHISTITDSIILLRYVEMFGEMRRGITVLKMRGSKHDKVIREYTIDGTGMHIGQQFRSIAGIIAGNPVHILEQDANRMQELFGDNGHNHA